VGLVAAVAGSATGMILGRDLGKILRLGAVRLVTTNAKLGGVQLLGLDGSRIFGVFRERPVAGLAGHSLMHAFALHIQYIGMAALADLVPSVSNRERRDLRNGLAAIMSVLPETSRDEQAARDQKQREAYHEDSGKTEEVFRILKTFHSGK
jgi:hypothetical protein